MKSIRLKQGNTKLVDRNEPPVENDTNIVPDKDEHPYHWLDKEDPRRNMTDQEILEKYVDLSDSDLNAAEKKSLYKVLLKYKEAFSLRDEIGLCPNMEIEFELNDDTPFFIRPFPIKETEKEVVDKEMRKGCLSGILKKGMSSYSSPILTIIAGLQLVTNDPNQTIGKSQMKVGNNIRKWQTSGVWKMQGVAQWANLTSNVNT